MIAKLVARGSVAAAGVCVLLAAGAHAQERAPRPAPPAAIQWFAAWDDGLREAKRTRRPILLVAAAPHCHEVSGLW
jgi:hypothetical protein